MKGSISLSDAYGIGIIISAAKGEEFDAVNFDEKNIKRYFGKNARKIVRRIIKHKRKEREKRRSCKFVTT